MDPFITGGIILFVLFICMFGIRIVRPTRRGLIETLGKFTRVASPGFNYIIPFVQSLTPINVTEQMSNIEPQEIITKDNLNARVDLVVYYKIKKDEVSLKNAVYEVDDIDSQLETLSRTTARNVIGTMSFKDVNSERDKLNKKLQDILATQTKMWGVEVLKVELKDITPPKDVQETMNRVIKAENEKTAAIDIATALETQADGKRRASIKEAEGEKQAAILKAEGQAKAFDLVNRSFKGNAQTLKKLEVTQSSLQNNAKIVLTTKGINPQIIMGELPIREKN